VADGVRIPAIGQIETAIAASLPQYAPQPCVATRKAAPDGLAGALLGRSCGRSDASRPPWFRARLSTILVWPPFQGGWTAILSYAHYTTVQPGETPPPDNNVTHPRDTHHPLALDGTDTAVQAQVRDLARTGTVGTLELSRLIAPPWAAASGPPSPGWTILTHSGSDTERRAWQRRIGQEPR
jgi:hypothetical protein